jgi:hypothetical protein
MKKKQLTKTPKPEVSLELKAALESKFTGTKKELKVLLQEVAEYTSKATQRRLLKVLSGKSITVASVLWGVIPYDGSVDEWSYVPLTFLVSKANKGAEVSLDAEDRISPMRKESNSWCMYYMYISVLKTQAQILVPGYKSKVSMTKYLTIQVTLRDMILQLR